MSIVVASDEDRECNRILNLEKGDHFAVLQLDPVTCEFDTVKEQHDTLIAMLRAVRKPKVREARKRVSDAFKALGDRALFSMAKQRHYSKANVGAEAKIRSNLEKQNIVKDTERLEKLLQEAVARRAGMLGKA